MATDLLRRVGQGLVSFGTGVPQSQIDTIRADRDTAQSQARVSEVQAQQAEGAAVEDQRFNSLANIAFGEGPDANKAKRALAIQFPERFDKINSSLGVINDEKRASLSQFAANALDIPFGPERNAFIKRRVDEDPERFTHTAQLLDSRNELSQNRVLRAAQFSALSPEDRLAQSNREREAAAQADRGENTPSDLVTFNALVDAAAERDAAGQPTDRAIAAQTELRTRAPAGTSAAERIANDPELGDRIADQKEAEKFAASTGADRAKRIDSALERVQNIDQNINNLDQAIAALDSGASTGAIESRFFPTIRESTVALEQIQAQLGLDVVQSVQFGALSEGELQLALATALPTGLQPNELREWIQNRQSSQRKLKGYFEDQIDFLDQGGTIAGFVRDRKRKAEGGSKQSSTTSQKPISEMTDEELQAVIDGS